MSQCLLGKVVLTAPSQKALPQTLGNLHGGGSAVGSAQAQPSPQFSNTSGDGAPLCLATPKTDILNPCRRIYGNALNFNLQC